MTLLVILGAGASYDIIPNANSGTKPPLTNEIFGRYGGTLQEYPGATEAWNQMLHGLGKEGETVETQLQKLRDESLQYDPRKRQLLAVQFFLQDIFSRVSSDWSKDSYPGEVNNLRYLVGELERWRDNTGARILYVTFNYDTLLEDAIHRELQTVFETMERYLSDDRSIIKVHGSWNWKRVAAGDVPKIEGQGPYYKAVIEAGAQLVPTPIYHVIANAQQVDLDGSVLLPAVAIPVLRKDASEFNCPPDHMDCLREWLKDVSAALVVGWHGAEEHFLKELEGNLKAGTPLTIVGQPEEGSDPNKRLEAVGASDLEWVQTVKRFGSAVKYRTGFSRFIRDNFDEWVAALPH